MTSKDGNGDLSEQDLLIAAEVAHAQQRVLISWNLPLRADFMHYIQDSDLPLAVQTQIICELVSVWMVVLSLATVPHDTLLVTPEAADAGILSRFTDAYSRSGPINRMARKMVAARVGSSRLAAVDRAVSLLIDKRPLVEAKPGPEFAVALHRMFHAMLTHALSGEDETAVARPAAPPDMPGLGKAVRDAVTSALQRLVESGVLQQATASVAGQPSMTQHSLPENVFRREGEMWTVTFNGVSTHLSDTKGVRAVAYLLAHPGEDVPALLLAQVAEGGPHPADGAHQPEEGWVEDADSDAFGDGGEVLSASDIRGLERRAAREKEQQERALRSGDGAEAERLQRSIAGIERLLKTSLNHRKRSRKFAGPREKARKAVSRNIRDALRKIESEHPGLWRHLDRTLRTGGNCSYRPESEMIWTTR